MAVWSDLWKKKSEDWIFAWLDSKQVPAGSHSGEVDSDTNYLHVFLKSARVVDVRKGFTTFYGTVHSYANLPHRSGGKAEFNVVTTPNSLKNIDAAGIDRVIQFNKRLLGPVPYAGGGLEIEVGLFSVASTQLAAPYLELLETLSKTAGVSYVSAAMPFVTPILQGIKLLTGSDKDVALEIGISTTLEPPRLGYCVAIRAPKQAIEIKKLSVDPSDFRLQCDGETLSEYPYMVLEFSAEPNRADWFQIPELSAGYKRVQEEFRAGSASGTEAALAVFRRMTLTCNDLLEDDARRIAARVADTYKAAGPPVPAVREGRPLAPKALPDLNQIAIY